MCFVVKGRRGATTLTTTTSATRDSRAVGDKVGLSAMPAPEKEKDDGNDGKYDDDANDDTDYEAGVIDSIAIPPRELSKHYRGNVWPGNGRRQGDGLTRA